MATSSTITVRIKGEDLNIYCHSDGYLEHNGLRLYKHYSSLKKAKKLIKQGNLSYLDKRVKPKKNPLKWFTEKIVFKNGQPEIEKVKTEEPHSFSNRHSGVSVFYKRDRGEQGQEAGRGRCADGDYNYYFDGKKWFVDGKSLESELKRIKLI